MAPALLVYELSDPVTGQVSQQNVCLPSESGTALTWTSSGTPMAR